MIMDNYYCEDIPTKCNSINQSITTIKTRAYCAMGLRHVNHYLEKYSCIDSQLFFCHSSDLHDDFLQYSSKWAPYGVVEYLIPCSNT